MTRNRTAAVLLLVLAVILPRAVAGGLSAGEYFSRGDLNWDRMATSLLEGGRMRIPAVGAMRTTQYAHKTPVFALILASIYATAGRHPLPVVAVQVLLSLAATLGAYLLAARITGSPRAGFLAALLTALYPPLAFHDVQIMETTLYRGQVAFLTLLLIAAADRPRVATCAGLGALAGFTVLTRTTLLLFLPLAAVWLFVAWGRRRVALLPRAALGVAVFLAVLSPWILRNEAVLGRLHLVTGGGRSLWIGTSAAFLEMFPERSVDEVEFAAWDRIPAPERARLASLDEIALDEGLQARAIRALRDHPERIPALALRKTVAAFSPVLNPNDTRDRLDARIASTKRLVYTLAYAPLLLLALPGLILLLRRRGGVLLLLHVAAFEAFTVLFWSHSRHRYYLDSLLAIAAAWTLVVAWRRLLSRRRGPGAAPA